MKQCRDCRHTVSEQAIACPNCGAPYPAKEKWNGWGFEYKSEAALLPLVHIHSNTSPIACPFRRRGVPSASLAWAS
jgi:hypothetical protein